MIRPPLRSFQRGLVDLLPLLIVLIEADLRKETACYAGKNNQHDSWDACQER